MNSFGDLIICIEVDSVRTATSIWIVESAVVIYCELFESCPRDRKPVGNPVASLKVYQRSGKIGIIGL